MLSEIRVLLASQDSLLIADVMQILSGLGLAVEVAADDEWALTALADMPEPRSGMGLVLLDARMPGVANGRLLSVMQEYGMRRRCAIALIAERVSDEWIARLREGVIDDIMPREATADIWKTHLISMQRGHALFCEVEYLRETSLLEVQHDPVTGTLNRDTLLTILFRETDRVQRLQGALSLMVFDVDEFGRWNSELGRTGGDQLLREVARRAGRILRTYDALGRMGQDEFMVALPGCSAINAAMLAERLRMEVFGEPFWVKNALKEVVEVRLSACFGITVSRGRSPVVVVREADQVLSQARRIGPGSIQSAGDVAISVRTTGVRMLFSEADALIQ